MLSVLHVLYTVTRAYFVFKALVSVAGARYALGSSLVCISYFLSLHCTFSGVMFYLLLVSVSGARCGFRSSLSFACFAFFDNICFALLLELVARWTALSRLRVSSSLSLMLSVLLALSEVSFASAVSA